METKHYASFVGTTMAGTQIKYPTKKFILQYMRERGHVCTDIIVMDAADMADVKVDTYRAPKGATGPGKFCYATFYKAIA